MYKRPEAQDNSIIDLKRMIEMLCSHIGLLSPYGSQNISSYQSEESKDVGDGDDTDDPELSYIFTF